MTLRIAVPNKGSLSESSLFLLKEAGYKYRTDSKDLTVLDNENRIEFFYLRPRDIAIYVGRGILDMGITGRDLVADSGAPVLERLGLGFAKSQFRFAAPTGQEYDISELSGMRIATSYPHLLSEYLAKYDVKANIIHLDGAVEISIQLGVADVIADVVESGRSLRIHNLTAFGEPICNSEAVLIERAQTDTDKRREQFIQRIQGVVIAQKFVMLDYDCPVKVLGQASVITPGLESPTISQLSDPNWVAVRAMVGRSQVNNVIDELADIGAKAILVSDIRICRM